jgi:hypothetical protein
MVLVLSLLLAVGVVLGGSVFHAHLWAIAADAFGSIVALQFSYLAVGLTSQLVLPKRMIPQTQIAIGRMLRAELEVPRRLPSKLCALVAQLEAV